MLVYQRVVAVSFPSFSPSWPGSPGTSNFSLCTSKAFALRCLGHREQKMRQYVKKQLVNIWSMERHRKNATSKIDMKFISSFCCAYQRQVCKHVYSISMGTFVQFSTLEMIQYVLNDQLSWATKHGCNFDDSPISILKPQNAVYNTKCRHMGSKHEYIEYSTHFWGAFFREKMRLSISIYLYIYIYPLVI